MRLIAGGKTLRLLIDGGGFACFLGIEVQRFGIAARNQSFIHLLRFKLLSIFRFNLIQQFVYKLRLSFSSAICSRSNFSAI